MPFSTLRFVYVDQLSFDLASLQGINSKTDLIVFFESEKELTLVKHHPMKIAFWLSSMRHFAKECESKGYSTHYECFDSNREEKGIAEFLNFFLSKHKISKLILTSPSEYRQKQEMLDANFPCEVEILEDNRFVSSIDEFKKWAQGKKQYVMEFFYREMRKKTGLLMIEGKPEGGQWNYDVENRKVIQKELFLPSPKAFSPDSITREVIDLVKECFSSHFGEVEPFWYAVTQKQAQESLEHFIENALPLFGDYQDSMLDGEPFLFHSLLSQYINIGFLNPMQVCQKVEQAYFKDHAPLNAVEGFIRQIIGWREFVRGIYWLHMPDYASLNFLEAKRNLPDFYWTAQTKMRCLKQVLLQTKKTAQSHHIQRLMVTGNFALLIGALPEQVCEWYLAVYLDAYEWVELPNTLGMALFGDGGILGTKPYASSGNYIHKMSNFCQHCHYNVKEKVGQRACPFNYLYWNFMIENKDKLKSNRRLSFAYKNLEKKSLAEQKEIQKNAQDFFKEIGS